MLRNKYREIAAVDDVLKGVFRKLVSAAANWPLFLHGPPGTGKTCAALALCDYLFAWQHRFTTATELTSAVMDTYSTRERFDWRQFGPYREDNKVECPSGKFGSLLVVLDEIGAREKVTDTHYESVQRLIDMREGLPLILISNHNIGAIEKLYDARIASRCEAGTVVELSGRDRRVT